MNSLYQTYMDITEVGDNGDKIFPMSSIGLNKILIRLAQDSISRNAIVHDTYLFNLFTFVRNNVKSPDPVKSINLDVEAIINYLTLYIDAVGTTNEVCVIFYAPIYTVPKFYARPINKAHAEILKVYDKLLRSIKDDYTLLTMNNSLVNFHLVRFKSAISPAYQIISNIRKLSNKGTNGKMLMMSHVPLDYHVLTHVKACTVLESYTAKYITLKDLGKKIIGSPYVPFNVYTHLAFGDKIHLLPVLQRKARKEAYKTAEDHHWLLKTEAEILKDLVEGCRVDKAYLRNIKL